MANKRKSHGYSTSLEEERYLYLDQPYNNLYDLTIITGDVNILEINPIYNLVDERLFTMGVISQ